MDGLAVLLVLGLFGLILAGPILGLISLARLAGIERRLREVETQAKVAAATAPASPASVPRPTTPGTTPQLAAASARVAVSTTPASPRREAGPSPSGSRPAMGPRPPSLDFATSVGPRLLVGFGGLLVVMALGFFVKVAWENDWVGPAGRVLTGTVTGLALVAGGIRLLSQRYRPLGQGLAGAGLAALYVSAYGAHGFYGLIPRELAAFLLLAITANAVVLAVRLEARLLALLAWLGAYLAPVLLSTGEDRVVALFTYLALLAAGALAVDRRRAWPETLPVAFLGTLFLYAGWFDRFYSAERLGVAAAGALFFSALFALVPRTPEGEGRPVLTIAALGFAGIVGVAIASRTDQPTGIFLTLLGLALIAALARASWSGSEVLGVSLTAIAVLNWIDRFHGPLRTADALLLAVPLPGVYLVLLAVRGLLQRRPLVRTDVAAYAAGAAFLWASLYRVLDVAHAALLGLTAVALAAVYLALALSARRAAQPDTLHVRTTLALAILFLTIAIPVQLGLHGITLGWAAEGVALVALGLGFRSLLTRLGGYAVLALAVGRLLTHQTPLHPGTAPFQPVLNAPFGTWLFVILAIAFAAAWLRRSREALGPAERSLPGLGTALAVGLFFALTTGETQEVFQQQVIEARRLGDAAAVRQAQLTGGLALSLLWTVFAGTLLGSGLALRNRALFYAAYGLFAVTAAKVALWDLSTLSALYRVFSFLAVGAMLLAGAYLNLRFRERLSAPGEEAS